MEHLLEILKDFSPMATIALALVIIYQLTKGDKKISTIKDNHLHDLPEMKNTLDRLERKSDETNREVIRLLTEINVKMNK